MKTVGVKWERSQWRSNNLDLVILFPQDSYVNLQAQWQHWSDQKSATQICLDIWTLSSMWLRCQPILSGCCFTLSLCLWAIKFESPHKSMDASRIIFVSMPFSILEDNSFSIDLQFVKKSRVHLQSFRLKQRGNSPGSLPTLACVWSVLNPYPAWEVLWQQRTLWRSDALYLFIKRRKVIWNGDLIHRQSLVPPNSNTGKIINVNQPEKRYSDYTDVQVRLNRLQHNIQSEQSILVQTKTEFL